MGLFGVILFYFFASSDFCSASFAYCVFFQVYASPFFLLFFFFKCDLWRICFYVVGSLVALGYFYLPVSYYI